MSLGAAAARRILKTFRRATTSSPWWKSQLAQIKRCHCCGGTLRPKYLREEKSRRLVCADCAFIAYQNPKIVAATLPVRGGRIYLLKRDIEPARGRWTFPAGYMELGESVEQAAVRETREEIRCRVKLEGVHNIYSYKDAGVVTIVYLARIVGPAPRAGHETQAVKAFRPGEIPWEKLAFRSTFQGLRDWVRSLG